MAFDWGAYLDLADELANRSDEAALRSAISRAYYAALGLARDLLESEDQTFAFTDNLHSLVWRAVSSSADDIRYYIGIDGRWLRLNRNAADYDSVVADPRGGLPVRLYERHVLFYWHSNGFKHEQPPEY